MERALLVIRLITGAVDGHNISLGACFNMTFPGLSIAAAFNGKSHLSSHLKASPAHSRMWGGKKRVLKIDSGHS